MLISPFSVWRHRKGGTYTVLGTHPSGDVVYICHKTLIIWYRPEAEFGDGRFTPLPPGKHGERPLCVTEIGDRA